MSTTFRSVRSILGLSARGTAFALNECMLVETIFEYRPLVGKCDLGLGLSWDEISQLGAIEAMFAPTQDDRRMKMGRKFRRETTKVSALTDSARETLEGDRLLGTDNEAPLNFVPRSPDSDANSTARSNSTSSVKAKTSPGMAGPADCDFCIRESCCTRRSIFLNLFLILHSPKMSSKKTAVAHPSR